MSEANSRICYLALEILNYPIVSAKAGLGAL